MTASLYDFTILAILLLWIPLAGWMILKNQERINNLQKRINQIESDKE